jgi:hypothetical protein
LVNHAQDSKGDVLLTADTMVHGTTLGENAFQLVTPYASVHMRAGSAEEMQQWIDALQQAVRQAAAAEWSHLPEAVRLRAEQMAVDEDQQYDVVYASKKPLGMVLRQAHEWAEVGTWGGGSSGQNHNRKQREEGGGPERNKKQPPEH